MGTELYRIYDSKSRLLYVGISTNALYRTQTHRNQSPWWCMAKTWSVESFPTRKEAEGAEFQAVRFEGALYNCCYNEWFRGTSAGARKAIPGHLARKPVEWEAREHVPAAAPYRLDYVGWRGKVRRLGPERARQLAGQVNEANPELCDLLAEESDGVPDPWGHHAVVAFAVRGDLLNLEDCVD